MASGAFLRRGIFHGSRIGRNWIFTIVYFCNYAIYSKLKQRMGKSLVNSAFKFIFWYQIACIDNMCKLSDPYFDTNEL